LIQVFVACVGMLALLQFAWIPAARRRLKVERSIATISQAALLATLGFARSALLLIIVMTGALTGAIALSSAENVGTLADVDRAIQTIHVWRNYATGIGPIWGSIATIALVAMLGLHAHRSGRRRMEAAYRRVFDQEFERLRAQRERGEWPVLPPTPDMTQVAEQLKIARDTLRTLGRSGVATDPGDAAVCEQLTRQIALLEHHLEALDIRRRMNVRLDPDEVVFPAPRNVFERIQTFFISRGLLSSLRGGSRLLHLTGLLLLVPALLGVTSGASTSALNRRLAQLQDIRLDLERLRIRLSVDEAKKDWEKAKQGLGEPEGELSAEEDSALKQIAVRFEEAMTSSDAWRDTNAVSLTPYAYRAIAVRDRILARASARAPDHLRRNPTLADAPNLSETERAAARVYERAEFKREPTTPAGKRVYAEASDAARRSPSFRAKIKEGLHAFQTPAEAKVLRRELVAQVLGNVVDSTAPDELATLTKNFADSPHVRDLANQVQEGWSNRFLNDLIDPHSTVESAIDRVKVTRPETPVATPEDLLMLRDRIRVVYEKAPGESGILDKMRDHPPSAESVPEPTEDVATASDVLDEYRARLSGEVHNLDLERASESLAGYDDFFTAQADTFTDREELLRRWRAHQASAESPRSGGSPNDSAADVASADHVPVADTDPGTASQSHGGGGGGTVGGGGGGSGGGPGGNGRGRPGVPPGGPRPGAGPRTGGPRPGGGGGFAGGGGWARGATRTVHVPNGSPLRGRFLVSRSFVQLRGFSRVGGVLIGREPLDEAGARGDFVDLRWEPEPGGSVVRLLLVARGGKVYRSGPVRKSVIAQALAYAADGRPTAVTMVTAFPLAELKILAHPTLVDTPMGARIIDLDRFVDTYVGGSDRPRIDALNLVYSQLELYRYAWARRIRAVESIDETTRNAWFQAAKVPHDYLTPRSKVADSILGDPEALRLAALALKNLEAIRDPQRSPLLVKKEFFDPKLVQTILARGRPNSPAILQPRLTIPDQLLQSLLQQPDQKKQPKADALLEEFGQTLEDYYKELFRLLGNPNTPSSPLVFDLNRESRQDSINAFFDALSGPPEFVVWSGVRERGFGIKPEDLLVSERKAGEMPVAFDFMLQVAFTTPPQFLEENRTRDKTIPYSDADPWEFPGLKSHIQETVLAAVRKAEHAKARETLLDASEFTYLQRLFRMAFEGRLGEAFPIERLAELEDQATSPAPSKQWRTPRWNSRLGSAEASALRSIYFVEKEINQLAIPAATAPDWLKGVQSSLGGRRSLLEEFLHRHEALYKRSPTAPAPARNELNRRWDEWETWKVQWFQRWTKAGAIAAGAAALPGVDEATSKKLGLCAERATMASRACAHYSTVFQLRQALDIARDDRQLDETHDAPLPSLDP
jgi:hypothetical protein